MHFVFEVAEDCKRFVSGNFAFEVSREWKGQIKPS